MITTAFRSLPKSIGTALACSLAVAVAGCGGIPTNRSLDSVHQPVVEQVNYTLDVASGPGGLSYPEQSRVANWFQSMNLRYGDRIAVDDPLRSESTRAAVEAIAGRYGIMVSGDAPVTSGYVNAGNVRIVVSRSKAFVPGCPNWSATSDANPNNATSTNFGCSVNSNLASMIANPEHLIKGAQSQSDTVVMSSTKAIDAYRSATPTGTGGLTAQSTQSGK